MINRLQHIMILGLYTFFSVFLGVVCITISDSFAVGIVGFFIAFLLGLSVHIFWIGKEVASKMSIILYDVEDGTNLYQQELKTVRDIIDNLTSIIDTIINDNEQLQATLDETKGDFDKKITDLQDIIEKVKSEKSQHNLLHPPLNYNPLPMNANIVTPEPISHNSYNLYDNSLSNVQNYGQPDTKTDPPKAYPSIESKIVPQISPKIAPKIDPQIDPQIDEDDFLGTTADDTFSDLVIPQNLQSATLHNTQKIPKSTIEKAIPHHSPVKKNRKNLKLQDIDNDEEFAVVDQDRTDNHQRNDQELDQDLDLEMTQEQSDSHQSRELREQLTQQKSHNKPQNNNTDIAYGMDDDEFLDVTQDLEDHQSFDFDDEDEAFNTQPPIPKPIPTKEQLPKSQDHSFNPHQAFDTKISSTELPALTELVPNEVPQNIPQLKRKLNNKSKIPSLDKLLDHESTQNQGTQQTPISENETPVIHDTPTQEVAKAIEPKALLQALYHALETNSMGIFIRPISNHRGNEVKFFETYMHLKYHDTFLPPETFIPLARREGLGINIDRLMTIRSMNILRQILPDIPEASLFCNVAITTLTNDDFTEELIHIIQDNSDIAHHIIFEFPQSQLQSLNSVRIETMRTLQNHGIRFSIDQIEGALPDLFELSKIGIAFMKISPYYFNKGINCNGLILKESDLKQACRRANMMICIDGVDRSEHLSLIRPHDPDLLQGDLLGPKERADRLEMAN
ncbi:MAG: EAL domain-containing protein (putative c-di-GMP-specific phosphodiesterase class I) [Dasania sp.]|jgi:EAL domain-containing protein (putative c-di-GMP-specific phosphodiesterase class I)